MICNCQGGVLVSLATGRLKALEPEFARSHDGPAHALRLPLLPAERTWPSA